MVIFLYFGQQEEQHKQWLIRKINVRFVFFFLKMYKCYVQEKLHTDWYHVQKKGKKEVTFDSVFTFAGARAHPVP